MKIATSLTDTRFVALLSFSHPVDTTIVRTETSGSKFYNTDTETTMRFEAQFQTAATEHIFTIRVTKPPSSDEGQDPCMLHATCNFCDSTATCKVESRGGNQITEKVPWMEFVNESLKFVKSVLPLSGLSYGIRETNAAYDN